MAGQPEFVKERAVKLESEILESRDCPSPVLVYQSGSTLYIRGTAATIESVVVSQPDSGHVRVQAANPDGSEDLSFTGICRLDEVTGSGGDSGGVSWYNLTSLPAAAQVPGANILLDDGAAGSTITVSGNGNSLAVYGGAHTVTVTGNHNVLHATGDTGDTITISAGNTVYGNNLTNATVTAVSSFLTLGGTGLTVSIDRCTLSLTGSGSTVNSAGSCTVTLSGTNHTYHGGPDDDVYVWGQAVGFVVNPDLSYSAIWASSYDSINLGTNSELETHQGNVTVHSAGGCDIYTADGNNVIYGGPGDSWSNDGDPSDVFYPYSP
jgi:hypothetical protein